MLEPFVSIQNLGIILQIRPYCIEELLRVQFVKLDVYFCVQGSQYVGKTRFGTKSTDDDVG